jgi:hypothetical protein
MPTQCVLPGPEQGVHHLAVGQHQDGDVSTGHGLGGRPPHLEARRRDERIAGARSQVEAVHHVSGGQQVAGHGHTHHAQADEADDAGRHDQMPMSLNTSLAPREAVDGGRHAAVDRRLEKDLADLFLAQAVVDRAAHMQLEFVRTVQCRQHREVDDAAGAPVQSRTIPHLVPAVLGDEFLHRLVEVVGIPDGLPTYSAPSTSRRASRPRSNESLFMGFS